MKEEFEALGINFHHRGAMTRPKPILAMRALWARARLPLKGSIFKFAPLHCYPKPVKHNVPIHVGEKPFRPAAASVQDVTGTDFSNGSESGKN